MNLTSKFLSLLLLTSIPILNSHSKNPEDYLIPPQYKPELIKKDKTISYNLRSLLEDTLVIDVPNADFKAEISYLAVDFKLDRERNMLKMCEFGEAKNASPLLDCKLSINGNNEKACAPFCNLFWHYLSQFDIPIWYVGRNPIKTPKKGHAKELFIQRTGWYSLHVVKGHNAVNLAELKRNATFKKHNRKNKAIKKDDISTYKGIIFYNYRDDRFKDEYDKLEKFKREYPGFLLLDTASRPYAANKKLGCSLFDDPATALYKPRWKRYAKKYKNNLAQQIFNDLKCDAVVIKPENSGRSNGIFMAGPRNLDNILKRMLTSQKPKRALNYRPVKPETYQYWRKEKNNGFIVEEYCPSQPLLRNEKWYDPTIRSFVILRYEKNKIYVNIFQGFWKLPNNALSEDESFLNTHCTRLVMTEAEKRDRGIRIEEEDVAFMRSCLKDLLPKVYLKMLKRGTPKFFKFPFKD